MTSSLFDNPHLFHIIPDAKCVVQSKGKYSQCDVYYRGKNLYAKVGPASFIQIYGKGRSSNPSVYIDSLVAPMLEIGSDAMGRLQLISEVQKQIGGTK